MKLISALYLIPMMEICAAKFSFFCPLQVQRKVPSTEADDAVDVMETMDILVPDSEGMCMCMVEMSLYT